MRNEKPLNRISYVDEYFGAWAMYEPRFNALREHAQQINVQLHLEQNGGPKAAGDLEPDASYGSMYEVKPGGLAVIELRGTLMKHVSSFSGGTSTALARRKLRAAAADDQVGGIMLLIDSPGGTVAGMDDLAADIAAAAKKKPLHAYIEDLGASAAYWAASQALRISCGPGAISGAIGVFNVVHDMKGAADKEGVKVHVVKFGAFKGSGIPGTEVTEDQLAQYQTLVDAYGEDFVSAVSKGRKLPIAKTRELADGRVHKGKAAMELGLVDAIESFDEAMRKLAAATSQSRSPAKGKAVTNEELKAALAQQRAAIVAACPGADEAFIDKQVAAGASPEDAGKAYMGVLQQRAVDSDKAKAEAEKRAADAEAAKPSATTPAPKSTPASKPVRTVATDDAEEAEASDFVGATDAFTAKVEEYASGKAGRKMSRAEATKLAARRHPELLAAVQDQAPVIERGPKRRR